MTLHIQVVARHLRTLRVRIMQRPLRMRKDFSFHMLIGMKRLAAFMRMLSALYTPLKLLVICGIIM